ncbi:MAG: M20 family metallo-hydrolase [Treponema sp.]
MKDFSSVKDFIADQRDKMAELEELLCAIPALAPESGGDGELKKCEALQDYLKTLGFTQFERFNAPDPRVSSGIRPNLAVTVPGKDDSARIWIMAHTDVVPPGEPAKWKTDPWHLVRDGDKLVGRGTEDNQQGLVSAVFAAYAFIALGIQPAHTVKLLFVADEEVGSKYGILYLLEHHRLFRHEDIILVPDGGDPAGETIEIAEKNILWLKVSVQGLQTHASRPDLGKNAHIAAADLALRFHGLEDFFSRHDALFEPPYSTFQPTKKEANIPNINTIPGDDVFYMDCRILPCYRISEIYEKMCSTANEIEAKYGVHTVLEIIQSEESPATLPTAPVVTMLTTALEKVRGIKPKIIGIGGGTVAAGLRNAGYSAVVWSTLDDMAHQPNEYCLMKNLIADSQVMAALMYGTDAL